VWLSPGLLLSPALRVLRAGAGASVFLSLSMDRAFCLKFLTKVISALKKM
jgi:hypothetical protein